MEQYLAEQDGFLGDYGMNNYYLYQFNNSNRFQFIPWDRSNTFESLDRSVWNNTASNVLMRRTLASEGMQLIFADALLRTAESAGAAGGWMDREIARAYNLIRDAAYADPNKQCDPGHTGILRPCTNAEFEAAVEFMTNFARNRGSVVAAQIRAVMGPPPVSQQSFAISDRGGSSSILFPRCACWPIIPCGICCAGLSADFQPL